MARARAIAPRPASSLASPFHAEFMTAQQTQMQSPPGARSWLSRDVVSAMVLLVICGILWNASLDIREPDYGQLSPATWPRIIIGVLTLLSLIYLVQSLRTARDPQAAPAADDITSLDSAQAAGVEREAGIGGFYRYWRNVIWCFVLFGLYLYSMPWLGMLIGALLFVFLLLNTLGGWSARNVLVHAAIALATVGTMWSLFTYGLGVLLPSGTLFPGL